LRAEELTCQNGLNCWKNQLKNNFKNVGEEE